MKASRAELALVLFFLAIVGVMAWETLGMESVARRVPEMVLWVALPLLLLQALSEVLPAVGRRTRAYTAPVALTEPAVPEMEGPTLAASHEGRDLARILWALALPALAVAIGILPASLLYLPLYWRLRGGVRWVPAVLAAVGLVGGLHLMLERVFGLTLDRGLF